jgi:putative ABC transport system permease protein
MALPLSYNVKNLRVRWTVTLLAVLGIALVVAVFIILVAMSAGFRLALRSTGSTENGIVVQRGAQGELTSGFSRDEANRILVDDRIARDADRRPLASPEIVVVGVLTRSTDNADVNVTIRGVTPMAFKVRTVVKVTEGRAFQPGLYEIIVGRKLHDRMKSANIGDVIRLQKKDWKVVGVFDADGSGFESEIWGDAEVMAPAFNRTGGYQSLTVRMSDPTKLTGFNEELSKNPQLRVEIKQEQAFYEQQSQGIAIGILALASFVGLVMGVGAVFGAMNTMYAIVSARTREIGTLRALGFRRRSVLAAFVLESVLLAIAGGVLGCVLALPINGFTTATGGANFSEVAFAFRVTGVALAIGLTFAVVMGLVGGLLPAVRAARLPITSALREA